MAERFDELRDKIASYHQSTESFSGDVAASAERALIRAPISIIGGKKSVFIDPQDLPENLPPIPQHMVEFAMAYAKDRKTFRDWANQFGVSIPAVQRWLNDVRVQQYIAAARLDARITFMANWLTVERAAFDAVHRVLAADVRGSTIEEIGRMARWALNALSKMKTGSQVGDDDEGVKVGINVSLGGHGATGAEQGGRPSERVMSREEVEEEIKKYEREVHWRQVAAEVVEDDESE